MKNRLLITLSLFFISSLNHAQNITLWGCTIHGGKYSNNGIILNYNVGTTLETNNYDFMGPPTDGTNPERNLIRANNGLLYGLAGSGGAYGGGIVFSYNISTGTETDLHDFSGVGDGASPADALIQANNNLLYGVTQTGGINNRGVIFSYDISTGIETVVYNFMGGSTDGNNPLTSLFQASNGLIYGVTTVGGAHGLGIIYSFNIATGIETDLYDFDSYSTDAKQPYCTFTEVNDSSLYGTTANGGINDNGTIFKYNILTGKYTVVYGFNNTTDGINPQYLTLLNVGDSVLYGTAEYGGTYGQGVIFSYSISTGAENVVHSFGIGTDGKVPISSIIQASNGLLYGTTYQGGIYGGGLGYGTIYSYDIATATEANVYNFGNSTDGRNPSASLIEVDTATISVAPVAICTGGSTALIANGSTAYTWAPATGLSATTGDTVIASPTVTTTYTITGTGAVPTYPTTVTVTVIPIPVVTANTPAPVCSGTGAILTANGAAKYVWSPSTNLSSAIGSTITATPTTTTTYTVIGSNGSCADTATTVVTVNPNPVLIAPTPPAICNGSIATLSVSGAKNYTWQPTTGLSATTGDSITANPTVTTTYTVAGTDTNGCFATTTVTVTITPPFILNINTHTPKCSGSADTLMVSGATTYTWSPAIGLSATTGATVIASPTATTTYTINGINSSGCSGSNQIVVPIKPLPVLIIQPPSPVLCFGLSDTLTVTGGTTYTWSPSTGLSATTGSSVLANPTTTVTYMVISTDTDGCIGTDSDIVTILPSPNQPSFTQHGDTLISSSQHDNQWYYNGAPLNGDTSQRLVITKPGYYWVVVNNEVNGCGTASDSMKVDTVTGIEQLTVESGQLTVYPNPTAGEINIASTKPIDEIKITNLLGQLIYETPPKQTQFTFQLKDDGMYFVTIIEDNEMETKSVVVVK